MVGRLSSEGRIIASHAYLIDEQMLVIPGLIPGQLMDQT